MYGVSTPLMEATDITPSYVEGEPTVPVSGLEVRPRLPFASEP